MYKSSHRGASFRIGRRNRIRHFFKIFSFFALPVLLLLFFVFLVRFSFFQVRGILVSGNFYVSEEQIKEAANSFLTGNKFLFVPKSNLIFLNKDKLSEEILKTFTKIESVSINRKINGLIELNIKERETEFVFCEEEQNECYLTDINGLIFAKASPEEIIGKIILSGVNFENPLMKNFVSVDSMSKCREAIRELSSEDIEVDSLLYESQDKFIFSTEVGNIILNPEENISSSTKNAILLIKDIREKDTDATFEYIDARFGSKMFYKLK